MPGNEMPAVIITNQTWYKLWGNLEGIENVLKKNSFIFTFTFSYLSHRNGYANNPGFNSFDCL